MPLMNRANTVALPQSLKAIATALEPLGPTACFYMAAAVSDFYLPWADMAQHKIQSSAGPLELTLPRVTWTELSTQPEQS